MLRPWLVNDFVRGAVTGLGVVNLVAGLADLLPLFLTRDVFDLRQRELARHGPEGDGG